MTPGQDADERGSSWAVVGGGMLGLTLALRLRAQGKQVTVFERADRVGGLASAWSIDTPDGPITWDRHYHVTLLSDAALRAVLDELGLDAQMRWVETKTGYYSDGKLSSVSDTVEFLRLPGLPLVSKLRLGLTILHGSRVKDWQKLERESVETWLSKWSGRATFQRFWLPLLRAKLGESWKESNAAFIWATIQRLYAARRSGLKKEMFGYMPGGYARVLERFADVLTERGVDLRCSSPVATVTRADGGVAVSVEGRVPEVFDHVVVTSDTPTAARLCPDLAPEERDRLEAIGYQGIVCASFVLRHSLSEYYLTYLMDDLPFTAVVEMTALVDPAQIGGHALVFLPKYVGPDDPLFDATDDEIEARFLDGLQRLHPGVGRADVLGMRISHVRRIFPIPTLGYSRGVPAFATSVPGLHLVSSAQIVNGTLNVNETVELAERARPGALREWREYHAHTAGAPRQDRREPMKQTANKPIASLSLDADNQWSYMKIHGDDGWESYPSYFSVLAPRALEVLAKHGLRITFFVVGQDAALEENHDALAALRAAGHEIGNHSFRHEPWLHRYSELELDEELARAEDAIEKATGVHPDGFRGPGYSLSTTTLEVLVRRGYAYDASTLPTYIGPLARAYYFRTAKLTAEQRAERELLYGTWADGRRAVRPYRWAVGETTLLELPVTTLPLAKVPIHVSYLLMLSAYSPAAARAYFDSALRVCRLAGVGPSILLHPLDLISGDDVKELAFFPGMQIPVDEKIARVDSYLELLRRHFDVVPVGEHARALAQQELPVRAPIFSAVA